MKFILMIIWGWEMTNLFVFVEGDDDKRFVEMILIKFFSKHKTMYLTPIPYQKKPNIKTIKHIKKIQSTNGKYIFLSDLDSHSYNCITSRKNKRINEFHHDEYEDLNPNNIFIVVEEIESWYISGVNNSLEQFKGITIPQNTETFTKEELDELIENSKFTSKIDFLMEICNEYDFTLAVKRNNSFKYFLKKFDMLKYI